MKKALFFDLDGTLWDALEPLTESWNNAMEKNNLPYRFDSIKMKSFMGLTPEETVPLAFPDVKKDKGMEYFQICLKSEIKFLSTKPGKLYENEEKVLKNLSKKYNLYIISNAGKGYIENFLNACNMNKYFKGHFNQGDTGLPKWQNILLMKKNENIDNVIYVGDTIKDMDESLKAGVKFIHASFGFGKIDADVFKISSFNELEERVEEVFKK